MRHLRRGLRRIAWRVSRRVVTEDILRQRLSINVRALRNSAGLTLKRASEKAEMHWRHWQKIEAAEVNITLLTLTRLGDALDLDPAELLREPVPRPPKP
jgi:transcriptional regulator with XRE-family HTH domain